MILDILEADLAGVSDDTNSDKGVGTRQRLLVTNVGNQDDVQITPPLFLFFFKTFREVPDTILRTFFAPDHLIVNCQHDAPLSPTHDHAFLIYEDFFPA